MEKNEKINFINATQQKLSDKTSDNEILNTEKVNFTEKKRYYIFDNIKGILIFMVVFSHFLFEYSNNHVDSLSRKIVVIFTKLEHYLLILLWS